MDFTFKPMDKFDLTEVIDEMDNVNELVDDINESYMEACGGSIKLIDGLYKLIPLLNKQILSPELAIALGNIGITNSYYIDLLKYGHYKLDVPQPINEILRIIFKVTNKMIDELIKYDSLRGGNLLNVRVINYGGDEVSPVKFKYAEDMIDLNHPYINLLDNDRVNEGIKQFKEEYWELFMED